MHEIWAARKAGAAKPAVQTKPMAITAGRKKTKAEKKALSLKMKEVEKAESSGSCKVINAGAPYAPGVGCLFPSNGSPHFWQ